MDYYTAINASFIERHMTCWVNKDFDSAAILEVECCHHSIKCRKYLGREKERRVVVLWGLKCIMTYALSLSLGSLFLGIARAM